jgi:hypothetical protein
VKTSQLIHQIKRLDDDLLKAREMGSKVQLLKTRARFREQISVWVICLGCGESEFGLGNL